MRDIETIRTDSEHLQRNREAIGYFTKYDDDRAYRLAQDVPGLLEHIDGQRSEHDVAQAVYQAFIAEVEKLTIKVGMGELFVVGELTRAVKRAANQVGGYE